LHYCFKPWKWKQYIAPKLQFSVRLYDVVSMLFDAAM
jgi:hypothetical protein